MPKFVYNKEKLRFDKIKLSFWSVLFIVFKYIAVTFAVAVLYYVVIALIHDSAEEKKISSENRYISEHCDDLEERADLLDNVIDGLQIIDKGIYTDVFNTVPPSYLLQEADTNRIDFSVVAESSLTDLVWDAFAAGSRGESYVSVINRSIRTTEKALKRSGRTVTSIPSIIPIRNFSITSTGASVGRKVNPFFKTIRDHNGIDLIAPVGENVVSTADGVVTGAFDSQRGYGKRIEINHGGGIVTTYSHLDNISVRTGEHVRQGSVIGQVGSSGSSFAPHLHYEVIRDGKTMEPVYYFFADLTPAAFKNMLIMAMTTGQSMD